MISHFKMPRNGMNLDSDLYSLLTEAIIILNCNIASILLLSEDKSYITVGVNVGTGEEQRFLEEGHAIQLKDTPARNIFKLLLNEKQALVICHEGNEDEGISPFVEGISNEVYVPVQDQNTFDENVFGCIYFGSWSKEKTISTRDLEKNEILSRFENIQQMLYLKYISMNTKKSLLRLISTLDDITRAKDRFMINHHFNVANIAYGIAREMGLSPKKKFKLYIAAIFHDAGKLYLPDSILNNESSLTADEYQEVKKHCNYGQFITSRLVPYSDDIPEIIKCHHERYDGKGYPNGLKGEEIPLESRIIALSDAVDAMTSYRSYKSPKHLEEVIKDILDNKGKQFDPSLADVMVKILNRTKIKSGVVLARPLIPGTLNIVSRDETYVIKGEIINGLNGYIFKAKDDIGLNNIDLENLRDAYFYTEYNGEIIQYEVKLEAIVDSRIYIEYMAIRLSNSYFSMMLDLTGLYDSGNSKTVVSIAWLGGDSLLFCSVNKIDTAGSNKLCSFKIIFEDGLELDVKGVIANSFDMGYRNYFSLRFVNMDQETKECIISRIFKLQALHIK